MLINLEVFNIEEILEILKDKSKLLGYIEDALNLIK